ncbi:DNA repair protein UVH3-like isoform X2 [Zingiber officinale]|nr:DNA repair protein UVH3-like isoform X2 [Zingiber officinale]
MDISTNVLKHSEGGQGKEGDDDDDEDDESEEMIFPIDNIQLDPAVLASLPPSMQLDLLVQMRERIMAENRQKYQKIKKAPTKFSELQIQSYLKTITFRREIDEIQKRAAGRGVAGVQTSRIASEANREFIFSSSFTGDKQMLTYRGIANSGNQDHQALAKPSTSTKSSFLASQSKLLKDVSVDGSAKDFGPDVETYLDEKGHLRVSRVRGLGIRMTRDLQRNLDLMEEYEQEKRKRDNCIDPVTSYTPKEVESESHSENVQLTDTFVSSEGTDKKIHNKETIHGCESAIEISFLDDDNGMNDDFFMQLVSGGQTSNMPSEGVHSDKITNDSESDSIWSEGLVEAVSENPNSLAEEINGSPKADYCASKSTLAENPCEEADMDWAEGVCHEPQETFHCQGESEKHVSKGLLEEEADMQEAIRRSLEDFKDHNSPTVSLVNKDLASSFTDRGFDAEISQNLITSVCLDSNSGASLLHNDEQLDNSSKKEDDNIMTSQANNTSPCKPSDELQNHSYLTKPMEGSCNVNSNTNSKAMDNNSIMVLGLSIPDGQNSCGLDQSSGAGNNNSFSEIMEELVANAGIEQHQVIEKTNIASNFMVDQSMENTLSYPIEVSEASLDNEISLLRQERADLGNEQRILERNAESVNNEMFAECQELLQMFGLPYIIAPTEAEAQCAYMEMTKLVDGVVTDDSDVFLFGARSVFKNIFDDRKYVETYFMKDIESELGLNRENLIRMAMLLGSDYTEGVSGIGIVNAIEVVHAFPEKDGLHKFREWVESPDPNIFDELGTGKKSKKESSKENNDANLMKESVEGDAIKNPSGNGAVKDIFMDKHRNVSKNWHISPSFPSDAVINAYTSPQIDESTEPFMWGKPDLPLLRKLCWEKFGWTNQKADELLVPVLKEYNKHETQLRLEAFYTFNERFAKIRSQRIKKALKGMTDNLSPELTDDLVKEAPSSSRKIAKVSQEHIPENSSGHNFKRRKTRKQSIAQESGKEIVDPDAVVEDSLNSEQCKVVDNNFLSVNKTGKEGRGRGRGRGRDNSRRKSVLKSDSECSNNGKNNDSIGDIQVENQAEVPRAILELRRSSRLLKQVKYAEDFGADENGGTSNQYSSELQEVAREQDRSDNDSAHRIGHSANIDKGTCSFSEDCPSREHLFSGGGFCVDENDGKDNMDQIAANQTHGSTEIHFEDRHGDASYDLQHALEEASCGDYLLSGGGFCIDENNERVVATQSAITNIRDLELAKNSEDPENIGSDNFEKDDSNKELDPQFHSVLDENISLHSCGQTNSGLSAMSSLRRKPRRR